MKYFVALLVTTLLALCCSIALAATYEPYYPSPFPDIARFSLPKYCTPKTTDASGNTTGVCMYYGYAKYSTRWAIVVWGPAPAFVPLSATECFLESFQGEPVCP